MTPACGPGRLQRACECKLEDLLTVRRHSHTSWNVVDSFVLGGFMGLSKHGYKYLGLESAINIASYFSYNPRDFP